MIEKGIHSIFEKCDVSGVCVCGNDIIQVLIKYGLGVCIMEVMYNKGCDLVGYDWCGRLFQKKGCQPSMCKRLQMCNPEGCSRDDIYDVVCVCFRAENLENC